MSVVLTRARIAALNGMIEGVTTSFERVPRALQRSELPASVIRLGQATYDYAAHGETIVAENRIYNLEFYIMELAQGMEGEAEEAVTVFLDRVRDFYSGRFGLELSLNNPDTAIVYSARLQGDSGAIDALSFPQNSTKVYSAAVWPLLVTELHPVEDIGV